MHKSKQSPKQEEYTKIKKQIQPDWLLYTAFIGCGILFVLLYMYKPLTIGSDFRYTIFVDIVPIVAGMVLFVIYHKRLINADALRAVKSIWKKIASFCILLFVISLFSYLTIGIIPRLIFEFTNYKTAKKNTVQEIVLPVDKFKKGSGRRETHTVFFYFNNKREKIRVDRATIVKFQAEAATKNKIKLHLREGIWNHYLVEEWDIVE